MDSIFTRFVSVFIIGAFFLGGIVATLAYNRYLQSKRTVQHRRALTLAKSRISDLVNAFLQGKYLGDAAAFQARLIELISSFEGARNDGPTEYGLERAIRASSNAHIVFDLLYTNQDNSSSNWITLSAFAATVNKTADLLQMNAGVSLSVADKYVIDRARIHASLDGKTEEELTLEEMEKYTLDLLKQLTLLRCIQSLN